MSIEKKNMTVQQQLDSIIERNKDEASALKKIIDAIEHQKNKKSITKSKK